MIKFYKTKIEYAKELWINPQSLRNREKKSGKKLPKVEWKYYILDPAYIAAAELFKNNPKLYDLIKE